MRNLISSFTAVALFSTPVLSGGWETGRLDNAFMYEEGGFGQFGA